MQTNTIDISTLPPLLQQELIDFYEFLCEKQAKNKLLIQNNLENQSNKPTTGFAMLKSKHTAVPADFDPANLLNHDRT